MIGSCRFGGCPCTQDMRCAKTRSISAIAGKYLRLRTYLPVAARKRFDLASVNMTREVWPRTVSWRTAARTVRKGGVMDNWDEIRTAYQVARLGTVSGAAEVLGVHHATVIRHIDALEQALGAKLFQRHARGLHGDRGRAGPAVGRRCCRRSVHATRRAHPGARRRGHGRSDRHLAGRVVAAAGSHNCGLSGAAPGPAGASDLRRAAVPAGIWRGACGDPGRKAAPTSPTTWCSPSSPRPCVWWRAPTMSRNTAP